MGALRVGIQIRTLDYPILSIPTVELHTLAADHHIDRLLPLVGVVFFVFERKHTSNFTARWPPSDGDVPRRTLLGKPGLH